MKHLCSFLTCALTCAFPFFAAGQMVIPSAVTFIGAETMAAQAVKAVFAVQVSQTVSNQSPRYVPVGSGFFAQLGTNETLFCITCNHVVDSAETLVKRGFDKEILIGLDTQLGYRRFPGVVRFRDPTNDIAVLTATKTPAQPVEFKDLTVPTSMFDDGSALVLGRGILIVGYPLALGIETENHHPVVRFGMIAQNAGGADFLIDAMASHGNSGSPVFALSHTNNPLVGMAVAFQSDKITLLDESGALTAQLPYNSGLARVIKASVISNAMTEASKKL